MNKAGKMRIADGSVCPILGEVPIEMEIDGIKKVIYMRVAPCLDYDCVLGMDFLRAFGIALDIKKREWRIKEGPIHPFIDTRRGEPPPNSQEDCAAIAKLTPEQEEALEEFRHRFPASPAGKPGVTPLVKHHIDVQGHAPIKQQARRISPRMYEIAHQEVEKMLADGIIERSTSLGPVAQ